jgi:hypothetical protein
MNLVLRDTFEEKWRRYFAEAELPIAFYYTDEAGRAPAAETPKGWRCFIDQLRMVRKGAPLQFGGDGIGCPGGKRYLGFSQVLMPDFEYFLSCGIPGKLEGERYKKTPELVKDLMADMPDFEAPSRYLVAKRWDMLDGGDDPEVVVFFAGADVLSGLFTLANFDVSGTEGVIAPMGAGCASIIYHVYQQFYSDEPRAVLGMFDVSARPWVERDVLTFAVTLSKLESMLANMDDSFLITPSWEKVRTRL